MFFGKKQSGEILPPEPFHSRDFTVYGRHCRWYWSRNGFMLESGEYQMRLEGDETFKDIKEIVFGWVSTS